MCYISKFTDRPLAVHTFVWWCSEVFNPPLSFLQVGIVHNITHSSVHGNFQASVAFLASHCLLTSQNSLCVHTPRVISPASVTTVWVENPRAEFSHVGGSGNHAVYIYLRYLPRSLTSRNDESLTCFRNTKMVGRKMTVSEAAMNNPKNQVNMKGSHSSHRVFNIAKMFFPWFCGIGLKKVAN